MFRKEVEILVKLVDLKEASYSEYGAPSFVQPKPKTNRLRFLSKSWNLNRQLKYKPCPMPKIREILLKLEVFKYATSLNLTWVINICVLENSQATYVIL